MHMKGEPMAGKENREIKNSVFVDLFYEDESAEANEIALFNAIHDEPLSEGERFSFYIGFSVARVFHMHARCKADCEGACFR